MRFWEQPRQPCVGLALCAGAAIIAADHGTLDPRGIALALVLGAALWLRWPRLPLFWLLVFAAVFARHETARDSAGSRLAREFVEGSSRLVQGTGLVLEEPRVLESVRNVSRSRFTVHIESIFLPNGQTGAAKAIMVWSGPPPVYGDRVAFRGDIKNISPARNPGQFDYLGPLHRHGIFSEIHLRYPTDGTVLSHGHGNPVLVFAHRARGWLQEKLTVGLEDSPEVAGLVQSMVLGLKDETPEETREMFQRTGTLHLFVVNGLHVGMFALIAWFLLKPFGVTRRTSVFIIVPLLACYALVTGLSPGSVRATIMAAILLGGALAERNPLSFNSLAAAAFAILLWDSNELFAPGCQFSFGVVFAIMLLAGRFRHRLLPLAAPDPFLPRLLWSRMQFVRVAVWQRVATLLAVTTSATIGSSPFTATYFHLLSPSSLLVNLLVVPLALALLFEGVLAMVGGAISGALSALFNNVSWLLAQTILAIIHFFAEISGGHIFLELPKKHALCEVTVLDLGAGGAIAVRSAGHEWLIDCGNNFAYSNSVRPFLRMSGVNRLDGLVLTHGDVAHLGAALVALADFSPREMVDSPLRDRSPTRRAVQAQLAGKQLGKSICAAGDIMHLAPKVRARVLFPAPGLAGRTADDKALVLQIEVHGTRILLMSDSGFFTERWLLEHEPDLRSDILVKGWHGSDYSGTPDFIHAVQPRVIICSGADFPPSEQVPEEWARDVTARGIALFRQDQTGAVTIAIDREAWRASAFLNHQAVTSRSR